MTSDQFDAIKQLITSSASQTEQHLEGKIAEVRKEMSDGFAGVADAITPLNDIIDQHELRLTKLKPYSN